MYTFKDCTAPSQNCKVGIAEDVKGLVYNYWTHDASRPTGDKKDVLRYRTGKNRYV